MGLPLDLLSDKQGVILRLPADKHNNYHTNLATQRHSYGAVTFCGGSGKASIDGFRYVQDCTNRVLEWQDLCGNQDT